MTTRGPARFFFSDFEAALAARAGCSRPREPLCFVSDSPLQRALLPFLVLLINPHYMYIFLLLLFFLSSLFPVFARGGKENKRKEGERRKKKKKKKGWLWLSPALPSFAPSLSHGCLFQVSSPGNRTFPLSLISLGSWATFLGGPALQHPGLSSSLLLSSPSLPPSIPPPSSCPFLLLHPPTNLVIFSTSTPYSIFPFFFLPSVSPALLYSSLRIRRFFALRPPT